MDYEKDKEAVPITKLGRRMSIGSDMMLRRKLQRGWSTEEIELPMPMIRPHRSLRWIQMWRLLKPMFPNKQWQALSICNYEEGNKN